MDRRIIKNHDSFLCKGITKGVETSDHRLCIHTALSTKRRQIVIRIKKSQDIEAFPFGRWYLYGLPNRLPSVGDARIK